MVALTFVEEKINYYGQMIVQQKDKADDLALGQLNFYVALRRVLNGAGNTQDLGMMDAINDTLQSAGLVEKGKTFYN